MILILYYSSQSLRLSCFVYLRLQQNYKILHSKTQESNLKFFEMHIEFVTKGPGKSVILSLLSDLRDQILRCIT